MLQNQRYWDITRKGLLPIIEKVIRQTVPDSKDEVVALACFYCIFYIYNCSCKLQKMNVSIAVASVVLALKTSIHSPERPRFSHVCKVFASLDKVLQKKADEVATEAFQLEFVILDLLGFNFNIPLPHDRVRELANNIKLPASVSLNPKASEIITANAKFFVQEACFTKVLLEFTADSVAAAGLRFGCMHFGVDAGPAGFDLQICDKIVAVVCEERCISNPWFDTFV